MTALRQLDHCLRDHVRTDVSLVVCVLLGALASAPLAATAGAQAATPAAQIAAPGLVPPTNPHAVGYADAARLLDQATFGATAADIARVQSLGIRGFIDAELATPATLYTGFAYVPATAPTDCQYHAATPTDASSLCARDEYGPFEVQRQFFMHAVSAPDQLRQRVAFALSQIFVVSSVEIYEAYGLANYQNLLLKDAFGNYRQLLEDVTLSPVMGHYLDMVRNDKTDAATGTTPNENYAREVLQLFSIGLYELNPDGSVRQDADGDPIATFDQDTIEGFAALFTGWAYPPRPSATPSFYAPVNFDGVMPAFAAHHESGSKLLLNGVLVPPGQTPAQDLAAGLDNIFHHPNVGPFIGKQLIQHLVTSNPSPAYVARIAAVFADDGSGVRGNLGAVVRAILTDREARGERPSSANVGHLRAPAQFIAGALRGLGGRTDGVFAASASSAMGQPIYSPETVFSFYPPSYQIPGSGLLAPEFGIENAATAFARANFVNTLIMDGGAKPNPTVPGSIGTTVDLSSYAGIADHRTMIDTLDRALLHGSLPRDAKDDVLFAVDAVTSTNPLAPVDVAAYLILTSAQYQVER
jgi:uncharacterized protein (DUF1800 family)